ncbi:hypothetical protein [uncultured Deinococcus sp.]|uniref:hypothetical protein n=1 Tax=uncultured Deinococcus sp. TaxID=158789 RepID=UPI0025F1D6D5|nr:hypothetical protein [uncultured Deinococcus sp.]
MYRVKYASVGLLTGKQVGDQVKLDTADAKHLLDLGAIETEAEYQARQAAAEAAEQETLTVQLDTAALSPVVSHERVGELIAEEEDRLLEPFKKGGGWYHFPVEGGEPIKAQGREAALAELARRSEVTT